MSQNTQPADFESWSTRKQIRYVMRSLYKNIQTALQDFRQAAQADRVAEQEDVYIRRLKTRDMSTQRVHWLCQKFDGVHPSVIAADPAGDPHFLAFCSAVAEIVLSA